MLPVISEYIGRSCSTPTMYYLGIDVKSLLECSLELPLDKRGFSQSERYYLCQGLNYKTVSYFSLSTGT